MLHSSQHDPVGRSVDRKLEWKPSVAQEPSVFRRTPSCATVHGSNVEQAPPFSRVRLEMVLTHASLVGAARCFVGALTAHFSIETLAHTEDSRPQTPEDGAASHTDGDDALFGILCTNSIVLRPRRARSPLYYPSGEGEARQIPRASSGMSAANMMLSSRPN